MKQQICILGSTGSIGTQALDVISQHPDLYEAYALTANHVGRNLQNRLVALILLRLSLLMRLIMNL